MQKANRLLMLLSILTLFFSCTSNSTFEVSENFDQQSPQEIVDARDKIERDFSDAKSILKLTPKEKLDILNRYQHLDPKKEVPQDLLIEAILYFDLNKNKFENHNFFTVINYKARSDRPRFFVIDLASGVVEKYNTAHGWGSDKDDDGFATSFGNVINSKKSSLGFAKTAEVYYGRFDRSIRIDGLSASNSNVRERAVVIHGSDKVHERPEVQGLSQGCPALDWDVKDGIIDKIQAGSLINMGY